MTNKKKLKIIKYPQIIPYKDPKLLSVFMKQPVSKIAAVLTGALSMGAEGAVLMAGRLVQGVIKGNAMQQFGRELGKLVEKGSIPEDYAKEKYGFQSLADILNFIDSEAPDEDRLNAVKALFISVISINETDAEKILNYQLFKLVMQLSASEILTLKICYDARIEMLEIGVRQHADAWLKFISERAGHGLSSLIQNDEKSLLEFSLINPREGSVSVNLSNGRLSDLGLKLCEKLEKYAQEITKINTDK